MIVLRICVKFHDAGNKDVQTMHMGQQAQNQIQAWGGAVKTLEAVAHFWAKRLNGLFLSLHDVRQGGIARLVQPQISCDDSR